MKSWVAIVAAAVLLAAVGTADAKKGSNGNTRGKAGKPGTTNAGVPDLLGESLTFKSKCNGEVCSLNNFTFVVRNAGDGDMPNSSVAFYLSDDALLNTVPDEVSLTGDRLIHTQALGKVKAGKTKKRTVGGGHLKNLGALQGQYIIAVVDASESMLEFDELNNVYFSDPLP